MKKGIRATRGEEVRIYDSLLEAIDDLGVSKAGLYIALRRDGNIRGWSVEYMDGIQRPRYIQPKKRQPIMAISADGRSTKIYKSMAEATEMTECSQNDILLAIELGTQTDNGFFFDYPTQYTLEQIL